MCECTEVRDVQKTGLLLISPRIQLERAEICLHDTDDEPALVRRYGAAMIYLSIQQPGPLPSVPSSGHSDMCHLSWLTTQRPRSFKRRFWQVSFLLRIATRGHANNLAVSIQPTALCLWKDFKEMRGFFNRK